MRTTYLLFSAALVGAAAANAVAAYDPPARVARLAYLRGAVSHAPAGVDDWAPASLNRPVVRGDRIWTEPGARDELQLGNAALRMDGATLVNVLNLDDQAMQVQLTQGTLNISVRPARSAGVIEVDTPNLALTIQRPGHYRISVDPAGTTTLVRVADGQVQVFGPANSYLVGPNQAYRFAGRDLRDMQFADANRRDAFDRWSAERDRRLERSVAARFVSPTLLGYEDLDDHGSWRTVSGYGPVWTPRHVARDWAPYRDGHWAWVAPWGWTWVDDAPWGFAVSHYGRWANFGGSWGWVPGPVAAQPVYAPALVVFVEAVASPRRDYGPAVGWFPLAPREAYRPPYPSSERYVANINVSNTVIHPVNYQNRRIDGATTVVPATVFARAQPVRRAALALPPDTLARAALAPAAPVQAQRESLASRYAGGHRPAAAALARPVMVHTNPTNTPIHAPTAGDVRHAGTAIARPEPMPAPVAPPPAVAARGPRLAAEPVALPQGTGGRREHGRETGHGPRDVPVFPQAAPPQRTAVVRQEQQHGHVERMATADRAVEAAPRPMPMPAPVSPVPRAVPQQQAVPHSMPQLERGHGRPQNAQQAARTEQPQPVPVPAPQAPLARHEQHQDKPHSLPSQQPQAAPSHPEPHREPPRPEHAQPAPQPAPPQAAPRPHENGVEHHGNGHKEKDKDGKGK
jgi:hypothetical protein